MADFDEEERLFAGFNVRTLQRELATAVEEEHKRVAVDEMKKRAIHTAGSYDEFKNLVACATQTPVESGALIAFGDAKCTRNSVALASVRGASTVGVGGVPRAGAPSLRKSSLAAVAVPRTVHEFSRDWRRHCTSPALRFEYVSRIEAARLLRLFKGELDTALLAEAVDSFIHTLREVGATPGVGDSGGGGSGTGSGSGSDSGTSTGSGAAVSRWEGVDVVGVVIDALAAFAAAARFDLSLDLLSKGERASIGTLFELLTTATAPAPASATAPGSVSEEATAPATSGEAVPAVAPPASAEVRARAVAALAEQFRVGE